MYLGVYIAFGVGSAGLVVLNTLILWIFCSIEVRIRPEVVSDLFVKLHGRAGIHLVTCRGEADRKRS